MEEYNVEPPTTEEYEVASEEYKVTSPVNDVEEYEVDEHYTNPGAPAHQENNENTPLEPELDQLNLKNDDNEKEELTVERALELQNLLAQTIDNISRYNSACQRLSGETTSLNEYIESLMAKR